MAEVTAWTEREMLETASRAVGRVIRDDVRGMTGLSIDEIAAMAMTLIALGLIATPPGKSSPANLLMFSQPKEAANGQ